MGKEDETPVSGWRIQGGKVPLLRPCSVIVTVRVCLDFFLICTLISPLASLLASLALLAPAGSYYELDVFSQFVFVLFVLLVLVEDVGHALDHLLK